MKKKDTKKKKYRTHPLYKAALTLSLLVTAFSLAGAYLLHLYTVSIEEKYEAAREKARYEAYLSLCESIRGANLSEDGEVRRIYGERAADALSRYSLFSDGDEADTETLRDALLSSDLSKSLVFELTFVLDSERSDFDLAIKEAAETAGTHEPIIDQPDARDVSGEWQTLRDKGEVTETQARAEARRFIGGGVSLEAAENHCFPLMYSFVCDNAAADITRMGGKLLRMWSYRVGDAEGRSADECRRAANEFLRSAGIGDAILLSESADETTVRYVFCGTEAQGSETLADARAAVEIVVARAGARVSFFDADGYYRYKSMLSATDTAPLVSRAEVEKFTGVSGDRIVLFLDKNRLFWLVSGAENRLIDAKTGAVVAQNP